MTDDPLPMPAAGGTWYRLPDGSLTREPPDTDKTQPEADPPAGGRKRRDTRTTEA